MTWVAFALAVVAAGATYYNTEQTAKRQDQQAVAGIQQQNRKQRIADERVSQEVDALKASNAQGERRKALDSYLGALDGNKRSATIGLPAGAGSEAFNKAAADGNAAVKQYGTQNAGLMATMEGATNQRMQEGFGYGRLGTDLSLISREAAGDDFINRMRLQSIRRNPWLDFAAGVAGGASGAMAGGGAKSAPANTGSAPQGATPGYPRSTYGRGTGPE